MTSAVTVLAQVDGSDESLVRLTESLDAQTLPYSDFDVVFLVRQDQPDAQGRLQQLAERRPNVVVRGFDGEESSAVFEAAREAHGEWVLPIGASLQGPKAALLPAALERVVAFGREQGSDVVVGRVSASVAELPISSSVRDDGEATVEQLAELVSSPVKAYRSEFLARTPGFLDTAGVAEGAKVSVLASYPLLRDATIGVGSPGPLDAQVTLTSATWREGALHLVVALGGAPVGDLRLSLRDLSRGEEYWVTTTPTESDDAGDAAAFAAAIDVRTAALGEPLAEGLWHVYANVYGPQGQALARTRLPARTVSGAVVDDMVVAVSGTGGALTIDVGATRTSALPTLTVDQVRISEDAAGTLLVARLEDLHVSGSTELPAALRLGAFRLPGRFVSEGGQGRLECFVSGLAGTSVLSHQIGFGPIKATSLDLVIDEVGAITVVPTRPAPAAAAPRPKSPPVPKPGPKPKPKGKAKGSAAAKRRRARAAAEARAEQSVVTKLRRHVPAPLEPAVRAVAKNPWARDVYRKLTGRPSGSRHR